MGCKRILKELTGIDNIYLEQIGAFGDPNRMEKESDKEWLKSMRAEPEARVITVAYFSLVKMDDFDFRKLPLSQKVPGGLRLMNS